MESNNNNNHYGGDEHEQLQSCARKRKLNELTNDGGDKPAGEDQNCSSKKNREEGNDLLDLELESMTREELIKLVRNQLETAKKATEESANAKQQQQVTNKEMASKMEEFKRALFASQHKLEDLTSEMAKLNAEYQKIVEFSNTTMDLPPPHRKLPAELNQQIFYCLTLATRRKFIYGLGWDFYSMFRQSLLKKSKRLRNPQGNAWSRSTEEITISNGGLNVSNSTNGLQNTEIYAEKGFPVSGADCRKDDFPGTICYYYEVKILKSGGWCVVGLSGVQIPRYAICIPIPTVNIYRFYLAGQRHHFEFPEGVIRPEQKETGNIAGCGLLMKPDDNLTIFFTLNGILIDRQFPIDPTVDHLVPTVTLRDDMFLEANFGDNPAKPFEYDIEKCPGMGLEWI